ncbi:MAG: type II toxin-antitoxin system VapC family toxin [Candidatus Woesearchaeota archaeon]
MYIIDTDFVINYFRGEQRNVKIILKLVNQPLVHLFITSVTLYELTKGCYKSGNFEKDYNLILELKRNVSVLDFDENSALIGAEIFNDMEKKGTKINESDILIASICLKNNFTLLTNNIKHFNKIDGLRLIS